MKHTDLTYLTDLAEGSKEFLQEMIEMFLNQTPGFIDEMMAFSLKHDWESIGRIAHAMKPSIQFMGISELKEVIANLEEYGKNKENLDSIPHLLESLKTICDESYEELKLELSNIQ